VDGARKLRDLESHGSKSSREVLLPLGESDRKLTRIIQPFEVQALQSAG